MVGVSSLPVLFVIQSVRAKGSFSDVVVGCSPFVIVLVLMVTLLVAFPGLALWLPETVAAAR